MDVTSYLLGKQAGGGGGEINNQNKSITITTNGTTNVTADTGYTGLGTVEITTNVGGSAPTLYPYSISFKGDTSSFNLDNIDFSNYGGSSFNDMFRDCSNVETLYFKNLTIKPASVKYMFSNCSKLKTGNFDTIDLSDITVTGSMGNMFTGCSLLTDESLDKILIMCTNCGTTSSLWQIGIRYYDESRIQALPHYQDFINAGWTIS